MALNPQPFLVVLLILQCAMSAMVSDSVAVPNLVSGDESSPLLVPGAPVTKLAVKVELVQRSVHLRVSWKPPTSETVPEGFTLPTGYVIRVAVISTNDSYCTKNTVLRSEVIVSDPACNFKLVPSPEIQQHGIRMVIRQECTYSVEVQSDPGSINGTVASVYTVPVCVGRMCRCRPDNIPVPTSLYQEMLPSGDMNVSWVPTEPGSTALLRLREPQFQLKGGHQVWGLVWYKYFNTSTALVSRKYLKSDHTYLLEVMTVTNIGCKGNPTNITFTVPSGADNKPETQGSHKVVLIVVLLVLSLVLALACVTAAMFSRRCGAWSRRLQPIHRWQSIYKAVSVESRLSRVMHERNIIYVEKEIEEAKARGEVDKFEVSYSRLQLGRQIGKGAFGRVFLARANAIAGTPGYMTVAVKKLKPRASPEEVDEFLSEIAMLKRVGRHPNVVTLLGCCTLQEPYCMLMEYVPCGDLLRYLRRMRAEYERFLHRPAPRYVDLQLSSTSDSEGSYIQPDTQCTQSSGRPSIAETECTLLSWDAGHKLQCVLDSQELHNFALQIAQGMSHLEQNHITHRDLAARNVLIDEHKVLKISDFGLSRSGIYVNTRRNKVPLRWLSVEAMREHLYSNKSDVWAFGVVLWEIGTLGGFPYPTVEDMNLLRFLLDGRRLDKPDNCSDELYDVMLKCWSHCPDERPTFAELVTRIHSLVSRNRAYVDFQSLPSEYILPPPQLLPKPDTVK